MLRAKMRSLAEGLLRRRQVENELADEIQTHLDRRTQDLVDRGVDRVEATRRARIEFGSVEQVREEARAARGLRLFDELRADVAYSVRTLRRMPGFTAVASISLALGIGANTLVFSLLDSTLLRPLSLPAPGRLVTIWNVPDPATPDRLGTSGIPRYFAFRDLTTSFESVAAHNGLACGVKNLGFEENGAAPERVRGQTVSPSMFRTLGVQPLLGRAFTEDEDRVDQVSAVVILSYRTWQRRYNGDSGLIGKTITLDRLPTTVIGVMPEGFDFFGDDVEFFAPLCLTSAQVESRVGANTIIARLKPGVSIAQAQSEVDAIGLRLATADPARHRGLGSYVESLQRSRARMIGAAGQPSGDYASALLTLQGCVAFVLLIACANVAGLLLARTTSRRAEVALRQALGASQWRVTRQLVTEALPLAALGAVLGVLLAWGGLAAFVALAPPTFPRLHHLAIDLRVLGATAVVALASAIVFAAAPALRAGEMTIAGASHHSDRTTRGGNRFAVRSLLVTGQIALALILLIGAGLMIRSFVGVLNNDLGADPTNLLTFEFRLPARESYKQVGMFRGSGLFDVSAMPAERVERVLARLEQLPGVRAVAAANAPPLSGASFPMPFHIEGRADPQAADAGASSLPTTEYMAVTRGYFAVMKIPLRGGRDFNRGDTASSPFVVAINETMARQFFPGEDPIGRFLRFDFLPHEVPRQIVGIVGDSLSGPFQSRQVATAYVPHLQQTSQFAGPSVYTRIGMNFVIRTDGNPMALLRDVKRRVAEVDATTPVADARTVEQLLDGQVRYLRLYTLLLGVFAAVAAVLAATGIYGVMAYAVADRTREIGIRMALGARVQDVLTMILRHACWLVGIGLVVGLAGALGVGRVIQANLFQVAPTDPLTFLAVAVLVVAMATVACLVPARRAAVVDPTIALKQE